MTDGGWMGVILRRVSDGAFVLSNSKTVGRDGNYHTLTFTQAELAPFVGVACTFAVAADQAGLDSAEYGRKQATITVDVSKKFARVLATTNP